MDQPNHAFNCEIAPDISSNVNASGLKNNDFG